MIIFIFFQIVNTSICDVLEQECWVQCGKPLIFPFRERCTDSPYSFGIADCWTPPNCTCVIPVELQYTLKVCQVDTCGNYNWANLIRGSTKWCRACGYDCNGNLQNCLEVSSYCKSLGVCGGLQMCNRWRTDACNKGLFEGVTCGGSSTTSVMSSSSTTNTPTNFPTEVPTNTPTQIPTILPTQFPTILPTNTPTQIPTNTPTQIPTQVPIISTNTPSTTTNFPTQFPTISPTQVPTNTPTKKPYVYTPYPTSYQLFTLTPTPSPSEIIIDTEKGMTTTELVLALTFVTWVIISSGIIFYCWVIKLPVIPVPSISSTPLVESPPNGIISYTTAKGISRSDSDSEDEFAEILAGMSSDYSKRKIKNKLRKGK